VLKKIPTETEVYYKQNMDRPSCVYILVTLRPKLEIA